MIINNQILEFDEETHTYILDGVIVPSVTQILENKFGNKYKSVNREVLRRASERGTLIHKIIEDYCINGKECESQELRNFKFLSKAFEFEVLKNEVPIVYQQNDFVCAGRLDLIIEKGGKKAVADIKTTSALDREYLGFQLNIYRLGYEQSYGEKIESLYGIHLRGDRRRLVEIPIKEEFIKDYIRRSYE